MIQESYPGARVDRGTQERERYKRRKYERDRQSSGSSHTSNISL